MAGLSLDELTAKLGGIKVGGPKMGVEVSIVTNQDDGTVSYAKGTLYYHPGKTIFTPKEVTFPGWLSTTKLSGVDVPLTYYFSDRFLDAAKPVQPFSNLRTDKLGFEIGLMEVSRKVKLTFVTWGNTSAEIEPTIMGKLVEFSGPTIGNKTTNPARYLVAFHDIHSVD